MYKHILAGSCGVLLACVAILSAAPPEPTMRPQVQREYARPGYYLVRVARTDPRGWPAIGYVHVPVDAAPASNPDQRQP